MRLTEKRKKILTTLKRQHGCVSARSLGKKLAGIDQATIYRNLDLFVKEGLARKFVFDGSESQYEYAQENHQHAVCNDCEKVIHFDVSDKEILKKLNIKNFDITSVELTVRGKCL